MTLPEPVLTRNAPDTPLMFTPPWLPAMVTGDDRPLTVSVLSPELTVTATARGTATSNLDPQLNTSPAQSMDSRSVCPLSVHVACPGLAAVPLGQRCTSMPGPPPGTTWRSEEVSSMTRSVPLKRNDCWPCVVAPEPQAVRVSDVVVTARARAVIR